MKSPSLSEQFEDALENKERAALAREVDKEAQQAERDDVVAFIERRVAFLNRREQQGDTFRADECLQLVRDIKAGRHTQEQLCDTRNKV